MRFIMKIEHFLIYTLFSSISGVVLWYILSYFEVNNAVEYSVFLVIILIGFIISFVLHDKGVLNSPIISNRNSYLNSFRNGKKYYRKKFILRKNPFSAKRVNPYSYSRKKFKN